MLPLAFTYFTQDKQSESQRDMFSMVGVLLGSFYIFAMLWLFGRANVAALRLLRGSFFWWYLVGNCIMTVATRLVIVYPQVEGHSWWLAYMAVGRVLLVICYMLHFSTDALDFDRRSFRYFLLLMTLLTVFSAVQRYNAEQRAART